MVHEPNIAVLLSVWRSQNPNWTINLDVRDMTLRVYREGCPVVKLEMEAVTWFLGRSTDEDIESFDGLDRFEKEVWKKLLVDGKP